MTDTDQRFIALLEESAKREQELKQKWLEARWSQESTAAKAANLEVKLNESQRENADLRAKLAYLDGRTNWLCTCGGTDCNGQRENEELLTVLHILARHSCPTGKAESDYNGQVAGTEVTDSGAIAANALALCRLAEAGLFRIVAESGLLVVGYWPENDPDKMEVKP